MEHHIPWHMRILLQSLSNARHKILRDRRQLCLTLGDRQGFQHPAFEFVERERASPGRLQGGGVRDDFADLMDLELGFQPRDELVAGEGVELYALAAVVTTVAIENGIFR
jgi:hypothetical protein